MSEGIVPIVAVVNASTAVHFKQSTIQLWKKTCYTVKAAQTQFLKAYEASFEDVLGKTWKERWRSNPKFPETLKAIEEHIQALCRESKMGLTTFNKYRGAARKACLLGVPFKFGANFTLEEIKRAEATVAAQPELPKEEAYKRIRRQKNIKSATATLATAALVVPLPAKDDTKDDYIEEAAVKIKSYFAKVQEKFGTAAVDLLMDMLRGKTGDDDLKALDRELSECLDNK